MVEDPGIEAAKAADFQSDERTSDHRHSAVIEWLQQRSHIIEQRVRLVVNDNGVAVAFHHELVQVGFYRNAKLYHT